MAQKKKLQARSSSQDSPAHIRNAQGNNFKVWGKDKDAWANEEYFGENDLIVIPQKKNTVIWQCLKIPPPGFRAQAAHPLPAPFNFPTPFRKARYLKIAGFAERCFFFCRKFSRFVMDSMLFANYLLFFKKAAEFLERIRGPPSEI